MLTFDGEALLCPSCGGNYLHHIQVDVFERREDAGGGLHVGVASERASVDGDISGNPSARRHGLTIRFECELCSTTPVLHLAQHKGRTEIQWGAPCR